MLRSEEVPEANRVSLERVAQSLEFRTTVMIKDVPNKLSRAVSLDSDLLVSSGERWGWKR